MNVVLARAASVCVSFSVLVCQLPKGIELEAQSALDVAETYIFCRAFHNYAENFNAPVLLWFSSR
jgi:hypothetical protein